VDTLWLGAGGHNELKTVNCAALKGTYGPLWARLLPPPSARRLSRRRRARPCARHVGCRRSPVRAAAVGGGAGAAEVSVGALLLPLMAREQAAAAVIVWRLVSYHLYLVAGAPVFVAQVIGWWRTRGR